jgi:hypothetical protein
MDARMSRPPEGPFAQIARSFLPPLFSAPPRRSQSRVIWAWHGRAPGAGAAERPAPRGSGSGSGSGPFGALRAFHALRALRHFGRFGRFTRRPATQLDLTAIIRVNSSCVARCGRSAHASPPLRCTGDTNDTERAPVSRASHQHRYPPPSLPGFRTMPGLRATGGRRATHDLRDRLPHRLIFRTMPGLRATGGRRPTHDLRDRLPDRPIFRTMPGLRATGATARHPRPA